MIDSIPIPTNEADANRWRAQSLRWRLLHGQWEHDAKDLQIRAMGNLRSDAHGPPDLSSNVFASCANELGIHYNDGVTIGREVGAEDAAALDVLTEALVKAGHAPIMQTAVIDLIGIREMFVRVSQRKDGSIMLRPVYPHYVIATGDPDAPDVPTRIEELRHRCIDGVECWTWDVLDVSNPGNPRYEVHLDGQVRTDITAKALGGSYSGSNYPYVTDGEPVLPYAMYHARVWPQMWSYSDRIEAVEGTLRSAVHWTFYGHALRNASWPQRVAIDLELASEPVDGPHGNRQEVKVDPSVVVCFRTANNGDTPSPQGGRIDSWVTSVDLLDMFEAIIRYERKVASQFGVSASDFERQEGDPRSAYALVLSSEGKVRAARGYTEGIRRGDLQLFTIVAGMLGLTGSGWTLAYPAVPDLLVIGETPAMLEDPADVNDAAAPESATPDAESVAPPIDGAPLAATALNGAQVQAAAEIVTSVASGALPRDSGVAMLIKFFQLSASDADEIMGSVGKGFTPAEPVQSVGSA